MFVYSISAFSADTQIDVEKCVFVGGFFLSSIQLLFEWVAQIEQFIK